MRLSSLFSVFAIVLGIFVSYGYLQTIGSSTFSLDRNFYTLNTYNITKENKWAAFKDEKEGHFFIHPGEKQATKGVFHFKKRGDLVWKFSIEENYAGGKIGITLNHNGALLHRFTLTQASPRQIRLPVSAGDRVEIVADKLGTTSNDHGRLFIYIEGSQPEPVDYLVPFLWSVFLIFLLGKGHGYLALNSYIIFLLIISAERLNFGMLSIDQILQYTLLMYALTLLFIWIYQELERVRRVPLAAFFGFLIAFSVYVVPLVFVIYALNFDTRITPDILYAVFQTNLNESQEYITDFIAAKYVWLFMGITFMVAVLLYRQEKKEVQRLERSLLFFMIITFTTIGLLHPFALRMPRFVVESFEKYMHELEAFKKIQAQRSAGTVSFHAKKEGKGETYIVIIGESLNRHHMGLYGYTRATTPLLSKIAREHTLIRFDNVYSNHVHTVPVLSMALTEANQYNGKTYYESLSVIDILKKAGVETYWLTNQTIYGAWDNMVSVIGTSADHLVSLNKSIGTDVMATHYDGDLIDKVAKILHEKTEKNRVLFVHLYGNHQRYAERYPKKDFSVYTEHVKWGELGKQAFYHSSNVNHYDNSVRYNDYVVASILSLLQHKEGVNGFFYFSDHADDVVNRLAHTIDKFTFEMTQIPMLGWFSQAYRTRYPDRYRTLYEHNMTLFGNDMMYDTMLGVFGIQTPYYDPKYDLSSSAYRLSPEKAMVNHGKRYYRDKANVYYWQKKNIQSVHSKPIMAEHINTVGMLKDMWRLGLRTFSVDVYYDTKGLFYIAGSRHDRSRVSLDDLLASVPSDEIAQLKLHMKNSKRNNITAIIHRLHGLDRKYHLKHKVWIETECSVGILDGLKAAGWRTLCHVGRKEVLSDPQKYCTMLKAMKIDMLSLHEKDLRDINSTLQSCMKSIPRYAVSGIAALYEPNFEDVLHAKKHLSDPQVELLLTTIRSQFADE